jgi:hypothetical protein
MTATSKNSLTITEYEYKNHTIEVDPEYGFSSALRYIIYPTEQGMQHDYDYCEESFVYMGNCKWADSIEEAKLLIDETVPFYVKTFGPFPIGGSPQQNITKFDYLVDAIRFAGRFNGELSVQFNNP